MEWKIVIWEVLVGRHTRDETRDQLVIVQEQLMDFKNMSAVNLENISRNTGIHCCLKGGYKSMLLILHTVELQFVKRFL